MSLYDAFRAVAPKAAAGEEAVPFKGSADAGLYERFRFASGISETNQGNTLSIDDLEGEPAPTAHRPVADVETDVSMTTDFLREVEGFETKAYVPKKDGKVLGVSGVTIASGVDLGQQSEATLASYGLPEDLTAKLRPYLGLKKEAALAKLGDTPLSLSRQEAELLNDKVKAVYIKQIADRFDRDSKGPKWADIPEEWRTVITSVGFQYGVSFKNAPGFWKQVTEGRWADAHANLTDFGDIYKNRRNKEAKLVAPLKTWDRQPKPLNAADIEVEDVD